MHPLPKPKTGILNLDTNQFPFSERLLHSKKNLKRGLYVALKDRVKFIFLLRDLLPKPKTGLPNLDFH